MLNKKIQALPAHTSHIYSWVLIAGLIVIPLIHWTIIEDMFTGVKWIAVYFFTALALFAALFSNESLKIPKLGWLAYGFIAAALGLTLFHPKLTNMYGIAVGDRLHFIALIFLFFNFFKWEGASKYVTSVFVWVSGIVAVWGLWEYIEQLQNNIGLLGMRHFSTFGNVNMTAEYLGLGIIFQLYAYQQWKKKSARRLIEPIMVLSIIYMFTSLCRSVGLATFLGATVFFVGGVQFIPWKRVVGICLFATLGIVALWHALPTTMSKPGLSILENKKESSNIRSEMWGETLQMIRDYPFGVGPGRFEYEYTPYQMGGDVWPAETEIYKSPHNEYLRFAVEDGLIYLVVIGALLSLLVWRVWKWFRIEPNEVTHSKYILAALLIYYAVEGIFQFPFQNPFPFYLFPALLGWCFSAMGIEDLELPRPKELSLATLAFAFILVGTVGMRFAWTSYAESHDPENLDKMATACSFFPENWRYCLRKTYAKIQKGDIPEAKQEISRLLYENPFNFPALRFWGVVAARESKPIEVCQVLFVYDSIFAGKSTFHGQFLNSCANPNWFGAPSTLPNWDYYRTRLMNRVIASQHK